MSRRRAVLKAAAYYAWLLVAFILLIFFGLGLIVSACGLFLMVSVWSFGRAELTRWRMARTPVGGSS